MATPHIRQADCHIEPIMHDGEQVGTAHVMYPAEPSSAAGRYQWEQNRAILDAGRRAWRASGQGQSRECRAWDESRRIDPDGYALRYGLGRRLCRELETILA